MTGKRGNGASQEALDSVASSKTGAANVVANDSPLNPKTITKKKSKAQGKGHGALSTSAETVQLRNAVQNRTSKSPAAVVNAHLKSAPDNKMDIQDVIKVPISRKRQPRAKSEKAERSEQTFSSTSGKVEAPAVINEVAKPSARPISKRKASEEPPISPVWLSRKREEFDKMINDSNQSPTPAMLSTTHKSKRRKSKAQLAEVASGTAKGKEEKVDSPISPVWLDIKRQAFEKLVNDLNQSDQTTSPSTIDNSKKHKSEALRKSPVASTAEREIGAQTYKPASQEVWVADMNEGAGQIVDKTNQSVDPASLPAAPKSKEPKSKPQPSPPATTAARVDHIMIEPDKQDLPFVSPNILYRLNKELQPKKKNAGNPSGSSAWLKEISSAEMAWKSNTVLANTKSEVSSKNSKKKKGVKCTTSESLQRRERNPDAQLSKLPQEVLDVILGYALLQERPIHVDAYFRALPGKREREWRCGIVYTCRRFYLAERALYYKLNTFTVSLSLFQTLENTMKHWPKVPNAALNVIPAIENVRNLVIVKLGPEERAASAHLAWRSLPQFLKGFKQLMRVELDYRQNEPGGIDWNTEREQETTLRVPEKDFVQRMEQCRIKFGWKNEVGSGIKEGALLVKQGLNQTALNWRHADQEVVAGLQYYQAHSM